MPLNVDTLVATYTREAANRIIVIDLKTNSYIDPRLPFNNVQGNAIRRVSNTRSVIIASTPTAPKALYLVDLTSPSALKILAKSANISLSSTLFSQAEHVSFPRVYGEEKDGLSHALYLPPLNPNYSAPPNTLPPLLIDLHGGPTSHVSPGLSLNTQFHTSRGYAVAHVNYSGSSGYGRAYRDRLNANWGIADIADAASCVAYLAATSRIDPSRVGIVGGSAGGYGVLQALCVYPKIWAGGVSHYGISGLKAPASDTHKFQSHYCDRLLFTEGMSAEDREKVLRDRSPCFHADRITAAVLLLQGTEDKVVPPDQASEMARVIEENGGEARVVLFPGEGHGFSTEREHGQSGEGGRGMAGEDFGGSVDGVLVQAADKLLKLCPRPLTVVSLFFLPATLSIFFLCFRPLHLP